MTEPPTIHAIPRAFFGGGPNEILVIANNVQSSWFHPDKTTQHARLISLLTIKPKLVVESVATNGAILLRYDGDWPEELAAVPMSPWPVTEVPQ